MIKTITVMNQRGEVLVLEPAQPSLSGFEVRSVGGLGPVKATINTTKISTVDGVKYNSSTLDGRNVVLSLGFLNAPTVEETRLRSYQFFPLKQEVTLFIQTDTREVTTTGRIESNEPVIWDKTPGTQVSIICEDAYFFDASADSTKTVDFYGTVKSFEFPFSNESLTQPLLEFGSITGIYEQRIIYEGDGEVGVTITVTATGDVGNLTVYNPDTNEALTVFANLLDQMTGNSIIAGDVITITTSRGSKGASLLRNGVRTNILNALGRRIDWLTLRKGVNHLAYTATTGRSDVQISIQNQVIYEGV